MVNTPQRPPSPTSAASVQVVVRLRPLNDKEKKHGTLPVVSASTNDKTVTVIKGQGSRQAKSTYKFDNVFTAFSSQEDVFEATLQPVIRDVLSGFESTVFAYGQTGTGKTHTMEGDLTDPQQHGVIPRSAMAIFETLQRPEYTSHNVTVSFLEIYNEDLCDLLADNNNNSSPSFSKDKNNKLSIMEGKNGPFCRGLSQAQVSSAEEVLQLMRKAQQQRQVGETNMNKQSSRSHCIFTIRVNATKTIYDGSVLEVSGKLHCVDLAGSECAKSADMEKGNDDQAARERERLNINRSLLTLGRVVSMLKEQCSGKKKNVRIPYRDSKLTRILQESLGGRCKTCLIATVSPSVTAIEESMSTLNYAQAANGIVNKPITSSFMSQAPAALADKIMVPTGDTGGGVEHWHEMECRLQYMQSQVEEAQQALARKHLQQQELVERAEKADADLAAAVAQTEELEQQNKKLEEEIVTHVAEKEAISGQLQQTEQTLKNTIAVLKATQQTEANLTREGQALLAALQKSIEDGSSMHNRLVQHREEDISRKQASLAFQKSVVDTFHNISNLSLEMQGLSSEHCEMLKSLGTSNTGSNMELILKYETSVNHLSEKVLLASTALNENMHDPTDGMLPQLGSTFSEWRDNLETLKCTAEEGEDAIVSGCKKIANDLSNTASQLKQSEQEYEASSAQLLDDLTRNVKSSTDNLTNMILKVTDSLSHAKNERSKCMDSLSLMVDEWKKASEESCLKTTSVTLDQAKEIQQMLQVLCNGKDQHDGVKQKLEEQKTCVEHANVEFLGDLHKQKELLSAQREALDQVRERNESLSQTIASNIFSGVQELVMQQMALMTKQHHSEFDSLVKENQNLINFSQDTSQSARQILTAVASTNAELRGHAATIRKTEDDAVNVMHGSVATLEDLNQRSHAYSKMSTDYAKSIGSMVTTNKNNDENCTESTSRELIEGNQASNNELTTTILQGTSNSLKEVSQCVTSTFQLVQREAIDQQLSSIEELVVKPSGAQTCSMQQHLSTMSSKSNDGEEKLRTMAMENIDILSNLKNHHDSTSSELLADFGRHKLLVEDHSKKLLSSGCQHLSSFDSKVSECEKQVGQGKNSIEDFTTTVVRAQEETPLVSERTIPAYNEQLSSTPSEDTILQGMGPGSNLTVNVDGDQSWKENELPQKTDMGGTEKTCITSSAMREVFQPKNENVQGITDEGNRQASVECAKRPPSATKQSRPRTKKIRARK